MVKICPILIDILIWKLVINPRYQDNQQGIEYWLTCNREIRPWNSMLGLWSFTEFNKSFSNFHICHSYIKLNLPERKAKIMVSMNDSKIVYITNTVPQIIRVSKMIFPWGEKFAEVPWGASAKIILICFIAY